jgi:hypothetical protein
VPTATIALRTRREVIGNRCVPAFAPLDDMVSLPVPPRVCRPPPVLKAEAVATVVAVAPCLLEDLPKLVFAHRRDSYARGLRVEERSSPFELSRG